MDYCNLGHMATTLMTLKNLYYYLFGLPITRDKIHNINKTLCAPFDIQRSKVHMVEIHKQPIQVTHILSRFFALM
jgi:hypothetical protein